MYEWLFNGIYRSLLLQGLFNTLKLSAIGLAIGFTIGFPASMAEVYGGKISSTIASGYVELFRGTPLPLQLFIIYFGLRSSPFLMEYAPFLAMDSFTAACLGLGLNSGAYQEGYIKGALESVSKNQMESARSLGMSKAKAIIHVVLPQTFKVMLPSWSNEVTYLPKYTSTVLLIGAFDLLSAGTAIASFTFKNIEVYLLVALIYLTIIFALGTIVNRVYEHLKIPGTTGA